MRALIIGLAAFSAVLAGCSTSTSSPPSSSSARSSSAQSALTADRTLTQVAQSSGSTSLPASGHYDVAVYLCTAVQPPGTCPDGAVTAAQTLRVQNAIKTTPSVRSEVYLDQRAALKILARTNPKVAAIARSGDLPPGFLVELAEASAIAPFRARFSTEPGVAVVVACGQNPTCDVATLQAAGVLH